jgi:hypothetical protein
VRRWLTQIGLYKLTRAKEKANDWVYFVDNTIQVGKCKCLMIVGVRLSSLNPGQALCFEDLEPIELFVKERVDRSVVKEALEAAAKKTNSPCLVLSDDGSDVKPGIEDFLKEATTGVRVLDVTHKAATILKKELESDSRWIEFIRLCSQTKSEVPQTELAPLAPPNQRSKCRYMNMEQLVGWASKMQVFMEDVSGNLSRSEIKCSQEDFENQFSWVRKYYSDIKSYADMMSIVGFFRHTIRLGGIYQGIEADLSEVLMETPLTPQSSQIAGRLLDFVKEQEALVQKGKNLLGSTEVLESVFGKLKTLADFHGMKGFNSLVLGAAACLGKTDLKLVKSAMEQVPIRLVDKWEKENIGKTLLSKRRKALPWPFS